MDKLLQCNQNENCEDNIYATAYEAECEFFKGRTSEVELISYNNDIRLDLVVDRKKISKLWGQVKDERGNCIENALITLLEPRYIRGNIEYFPIATTLSDCMGFYQFEIEDLEKGLKYRVNASKS